MSGTLYLVATPIGNLGDMTFRAVEVLKSVDFIAAEDTRVARKLLTCFDITKPLVSYYEHNLRERGEEILARLLAGESCALTTDAGMPAVSDPGCLLVAQCREAGVPVTCVPGACAAVTAFALSGCASGRFCFEGFLSVNRKNRREHLESLRGERRPMIFYEAPHKLRTTLSDLAEFFGPDRGLFLARELTKLHEESVRTTVGGAAALWAQTPPRGEFVLIVDGRPEDGGLEKEEAAQDALALARRYLSEGESVREAARRAALETGEPRNALYRRLLSEQPEDGAL